MADVSQTRPQERCARTSSPTCRPCPVGFFDRNPAGELMSRLTNDIDAINQAVSQNVTSLLASVLSLVGILVGHVRPRQLAGPGLAPGRPDHVLVHRVRRPLHAPGVPGAAEGPGRAQRSVMEESISGQKVVKAFRRNDVGAGGLPASNQAVFQGRSRGQQLRLPAHAADERAGQLLRHRPGRAGRLARPAAGSSPSGSSRPSSATGRTSSIPCASWPTCTTPSRRPWPGPSGSSRSSTRRREPDAAGGRRSAGPVRGHVRFEHVDFGYLPGDARHQGHDRWRPAQGRRSPWSGRPAPARRPSSTC